MIEQPDPDSDTGTDVWTSPATGDALAPDLVRRLLIEYTRPNDIVVDIDDDPSLAVAAAETGRHHHAFGGTQRLVALGEAAGSVRMAVVRWPRPRPINPRWLLVACRVLLHPEDGVLVIVVRLPDTQRTAHLAALTGAADGVGLRYRRRIIVIEADDGHVATPTRSRGAASPAGGHTPPGVDDTAVPASRTELLILACASDAGTEEGGRS